AGRPVYEVKINSITMIGVADPEGQLSGMSSGEEPESGIGSTIVFAGLFLVLALGIGYVVIQNNKMQDVSVY
ncbi:MAG: hypothetical protein ACPH9K_08030, partial [Candidatus Poseidoniaceae archaeon]